MSLPVEIYTGLTALKGNRPASIALGFFDGVHIGHRDVIRAAVEYGEQNGLEPAVFTFQLPFQNTLKGGRICTEERKHRLICNLGVKHCLEPDFETFRELTPEDFVQKVLVDTCRAKAVFCGNNFTFGKKAAGNVTLLRQLCEPLGIRVFEVPMTIYEGEPVSSTRIRKALEEGDMPTANAMLGRPYQVEFPVQHGKGLGRTLGFPTINQIIPEGYVSPKEGIYITLTQVQEGLWLPSATGFGRRPTVDKSGAAPTCETFIAQYDGDLYNECPAVRFYKYLAPTRKFDSLEELTACIQDAAAQSMKYHEEKAASVIPKQPSV